MPLYFPSLIPQSKQTLKLTVNKSVAIFHRKKIATISKIQLLLYYHISI